MKVNFDMRNGRISIEGDAPDLLNILHVAKEIMPNVSHIQITAGPSVERSSSQGTNQSKGAPRETASRQTMRQFARSLSLNNATERIAALAYYANKVDGRSYFSPKELDGWFTMCGFQKPAQMSVALYDAKRKYGYVENASRGNWRISNQGENVIIGKMEQQDDNE